MRILLRGAALALSLLPCAVTAQGAFIAYVNPAGPFNTYVGSPFGTVPWGMDFDVNSPVNVSALGSYDDLQDGVFLHDVVVGIFDRDTQNLVGATQTFSTASPGALIGGSRFKSLASPITLPAGFHGSIVAWGITEANSGGEPLVDESNNTPTWTLDTGGGLLSFVGTSRLLATGSASITYPSVPDTFVVHGSYASHQYMAGTFQFAAVPEPSTIALAGLAIAVVSAAFYRRRG